jgi:glycosyltransferase involved in cell wall biosynthesis
LHQPAALRGLGALAERRCHTMADATTFVCQLDGRIARRWRLLPRGARTHQIPNGIDPTEFPEPVVGDGPTVVFLGNLIHQKHPELFVELAARLAHEAPSSRFVMIGGGDLEGRVRQLIGAYHLTPRFTLTGRIPRDQALLHLAAASVLVMPSRWEGAPVVLLEAMQLGVPVVCSDFEAMKEFVRDGVTGLLVGQRDPAAYATAVRRVLDDEALRARLVSAARQQVQDHYLRSTITARYRELYQQLLETGGLA